MKSILRFLIGASLLSCFALAQSGAGNTSSNQGGHVEGRITFYNGIAFMAAQVTFQSENRTQTVSADKLGFYQVDLPAGIYCMSIKPPKGDALSRYFRPLFRVESGSTNKLNATLYPDAHDCDSMGRAKTDRPLTEEEEREEREYRNGCRGESHFRIPYQNVPFPLYIRFSVQSSVEGGWEYNGDRWVGGIWTPVVVTYNLSSIQADRVVYKVQSHGLLAEGNVTFEADGVTQRANAMRVRVESGRLVRVAEQN